MSKLPGIYAVCALLMLSGCSPTSTFSDLNKPPSVADAPSSEFLDSAKNLDESSIRFVGNDDGARLWIATGIKVGEMCLVVQGVDDSWKSACGGSPVSVGVRPQAEYLLYPDGARPPDGAKRISENIFVTKG